MTTVVRIVTIIKKDNFQAKLSKAWTVFITSEAGLCLAIKTERPVRGVTEINRERLASVIFV